MINHGFKLQSVVERTYMSGFNVRREWKQEIIYD
jgi:hypothetical protein